MKRLLIALGLAGLMAPSALIAQEEPETSSAEEEVSAPSIDEIIVTANRREQNLQEVVGGIQVFSGEDLEKQGVDGIEDYILKVPGAGMQKDGTGGTKLGIRGISNVAGVAGVYDGVSTVGLYINDIPMQGSGNLPDLSLYDLNRVEVLKGPQGTLYGEGSMGGAIKMILNYANLEEYEFKADSQTSYTEEGGVNWYAKTAIGGPIMEDRIGLRLVGSYKEDSGYIDYTTLGVEDANSSNACSARALMNADFDSLKLEAMILLDRSDMDQLSQVEDGKQTLENEQHETQFSQTEFNLYGLTAKYDFGPVELTSVSSLIQSNRDIRARAGLTAGILEGNSIDLIIEETTGVDVIGDFMIADVFQQDVINNEPAELYTDETNFAQELRLLSTGDNRLDWVAGLFYRNRTSDFFIVLYQPDTTPCTDPSGGSINEGLGEFSPCDNRGYERYGEETFVQYAAYVEGNYELTESLELTLGLRYFHETVGLNDTFDLYNFYAFLYTAFGSETTIRTQMEPEVDGFLPKASLKWQIDDDLMVYGVISRGFRSGGPNANASFEVGDEIMDPDYLWNYEVGYKSRWFGGALTVNGTAFYLDWTDIQLFKLGVGRLGEIPTELVYFDNAGDAEVFGTEIETLLFPFEGAMIGINASYLKGEIVRVDPDSDTQLGSPLSSMPEVSISAFAAYTWDLSGFLGNDTTLTAAGAWQYVDDMLTVVKSNTDPTGRPLEGYEQAQLNLSLDGLNWGVALFVHNLMDERPQTSRSGTYTRRFTAIGRPRTFGLNVRIGW